MRRLLATILVLVLGFVSPVLAQTASPDAANNPQSSPQVGDNATVGDTGLDALAQEPPPPPNYTGLLIGGLAVGGIVTIAVVASQNNNNNNNTTTTNKPKSP